VSLGSQPEIIDCRACGAKDRAGCVTASGAPARQAHKVRRRDAALHDDGRGVYGAAVAERRRVRNAMHALGFERVGAGEYVHEVGSLLASYDEHFTGPLGTVTIGWR